MKQKAEGRRQKAEGRRQKAEGRRQKAKGKRQKGKRQKAEARRQNHAVANAQAGRRAMEAVAEAAADHALRALEGTLTVKDGDRVAPHVS